MISKYGTISICVMLFIISIAWGDDGKTYYASSIPFTLHSRIEGRYLDFGVFVDANGRTIVFYTHKDGKEAFVSVFDGNQLNDSAVIPYSKGMMNNGTFQVYGYEASGKMQICTLSSDMKPSFQPTNKIKDNSRKAISYLIPLTGAPDKFFAVGQYTEARLNPLSLARFVLSAGHGARAERLFGAIIEKDKIEEYYDVPGPVEENEYASGIKSIMDGNTVHVVWIKKNEYSFDPEVIKYSSFDLSSKRWSKPEELFRGDEERYTANLYLSSPTLACVKENAYCVWSLEPSGHSHIDKKESKMEPGVYFCGKTNGHWDKPIKLADSGGQPLVLVNNFGTVYVFWIEESGLFYKYKTGTDWSDRYLVVEDREISKREKGFSPPLSISVDQDNNLHVVYIHKGLTVFEHPERNKPEEIVYVKLIYRK